MLKSFSDIFFAILLAIGFLAYLSKLIWIFFKPRFLSNFKTATVPPTKTELIIYYTLAMAITFYGLLQKLGVIEKYL
ncbi:hypothetical protein ACQ33O_03185 [Ferruginibacter sp. SUN002]|uniref:hypothetical protein n=1 Tax=Ferruginibacter sp. SUN002 TaxID=2937789 RepID=UPI003D35B24F